MKKILCIGLCAISVMSAAPDRVVLPDGSLDTSFNAPNGFIETPIPGQPFSTANGVYIHFDGTISLCGNNFLNVLSRSFNVVQYLPNGTLNPAFGSGGIATIPVVATGNVTVTAKGIATQSDGKLVIVGTVAPLLGAQETVRQGVTKEIFVARLLPNGTLDPSFNGTGIQFFPSFSAGSSDTGNAVVIDVNGNIVIVGTTTPVALPLPQMAVGRLTKTGAIDLTFNGTGKQTVNFGIAPDQTSQGLAVALTADGQTIIAAGQSDQTPGAIGQNNFAYAQISPVGAIEITNVVPFSTNAGHLIDITTICQAVLVQPNGAIVLIGSTDWYDGNSYFALARYTGAGALDAAFVGDQISENPGTFVSPALGGGVDNPEASMAFGGALQADGKIVVVGQGPNLSLIPKDMNKARQFSEFFMMSARYLGTNGNLDTTYNGGGPFSPVAPPGYVWTATNNSDSVYGFNAVALQAPATGATNAYIVGAGFAGDGGIPATSQNFAAVRYIVDNPFVPLQLPVITPPFIGTGPVTITGIAQNPSIVDLFFDSITASGQIGSTVTIGSTPNWSFTTTGPVSGQHTAFAVARYRDDGHVNLESSITIGCPGFSPTGFFAQLLASRL